MFRPYRIDGLKWWAADEWEAAYEANEGMWPDSTPWSRKEWDKLYSQGYRYCALLKKGRAVATAGLWPRTNEETPLMDYRLGRLFRTSHYQTLNRSR